MGAGLVSRMPASWVRSLMVVICWSVGRLVRTVLAPAVPVGWPSRRSACWLVSRVPGMSVRTASAVRVAISALGAVLLAGISRMLQAGHSIVGSEAARRCISASVAWGRRGLVVAVA